MATLTRQWFPASHSTLFASVLAAFAIKIIRTTKQGVETVLDTFTVWVNFSVNFVNVFVLFLWLVSRCWWTKAHSQTPLHMACGRVGPGTLNIIQVLLRASSKDCRLVADKARHHSCYGFSMSKFVRIQISRGTYYWTSDTILSGRQQLDIIWE